MLTLIALGGCAGLDTQPVTPTPATYAQETIPEDQLLDVGIEVFDPGSEGNDKLVAEGSHESIRRAEAHFIPIHLRNTLQLTGHWGAVRVTPGPAESVDLDIKGTIVKSNGEELVIDLVARDASGAEWLNKRYRARANQHHYTSSRNGYEDPYQDLYNTISNDLAAFKQHLRPQEIRTLRNISRLRFAADIAPDAFQDYLRSESNGAYALRRLPADDDPMMRRVLRVREREQMLIDTVNEHYSQFYGEMWDSYVQWRQSHLEEVMAKREIDRQARNRFLLGAAAIAAAIAGEIAGGDYWSSDASTLLVLGGGVAIKSGMDKVKEAQIHKEAIEELGDSFGADVAPVVTQVEGHTVRLQGSAEEQYRTWRRLLREIFAAETGFPLDGQSSSTPVSGQRNQDK